MRLYCAATITFIYNCVKLELYIDGIFVNFFFPHFFLFGYVLICDVPFLFGSSLLACLQMLCRSQGMNHKAMAHSTVEMSPENLEHCLCSAVSKYL